MNSDTDIIVIITTTVTNTTSIAPLSQAPPPEMHLTSASTASRFVYVSVHARSCAKLHAGGGSVRHRVCCSCSSCLGKTVRVALLRQRLSCCCHSAANVSAAVCVMRDISWPTKVLLLIVALDSDVMVYRCKYAHTAPSPPPPYTQMQALGRGCERCAQKQPAADARHEPFQAPGTSQRKVLRRG